VKPDHVDEALAAAASGPVGEGGVGGGTGMVCHEFKGGIGTASRVVDAEWGGFTVGVLVQANYGGRDRLRIDGVPVGEAIPVNDVPSPYGEGDDDDALPVLPAPGSGSIIVIVATDAPLLPHHERSLAPDQGREPDPHALDVGDGVQGSGGQQPDREPEVPVPRHGAGA
jgi:D-aminopeptidase